MPQSPTRLIFGLGISILLGAPATLAADGSLSAGLPERPGILGRAAAIPARSVSQAKPAPPFRQPPHRVSRVGTHPSGWLSVRHTDGQRLLSEWLVRPIDGDTFAYGPERIRVQGVNAPELADSGGFEAAQRLDSLLHEGPVRILPKARDKYGRTVAEVFVNDRNVASILKNEGYARR